MVALQSVTFLGGRLKSNAPRFGLKGARRSLPTAGGRNFNVGGATGVLLGDGIGEKRIIKALGIRMLALLVGIALGAGLALALG
jgi:hypothetical protein